MRSFSDANESGQSTVEAAVLLPVLLVVLGILIQPAILLYTQSVMNAAVSESCRLAATNTNDDASMRAYIERRLSAIPALEIFHSGEWEIEWNSEGAGEAEVRVKNHVQPLPLLGVIAGLSSVVDANGMIEQQAHAQCSPVPSWVLQQGYAPSDWINSWS